MKDPLEDVQLTETRQQSFLVLAVMLGVLLLLFVTSPWVAAIIVGLILAAFAAMMMIPLLFDLDHGHRNWAAFATAGAITLFAGGILAGGGWSGRSICAG